MTNLLGEGGDPERLEFAGLFLLGALRLDPTELFLRDLAPFEEFFTEEFATELFFLFALPF